VDVLEQGNGGVRLRLSRRITAWLASRLRAIIVNRRCDQEIGPPEQPYMLRWVLFRKEWLGGLYLHIFLNDDDDRALHDHPFPSLSITLSGEIREVYSERGWNPSDKSQHSVRMIRDGDIVWRSAKFAHRLELRSATAMTLFIIGPHIKPWGFFCKRGWIPWQEYAHPESYSDPQHYGRIGAGCGEE
jgi:hypothetical protein